MVDNSSRELVYTSTYVSSKISELSRSAEHSIYENIVGSAKIEDVPYTTTHQGGRFGLKMVRETN